MKPKTNRSGKRAVAGVSGGLLCILLSLLAGSASAQTVQTLCSFNNTNGANPAALTLGHDGSFYGTTHDGGSSDYGTVFKVTTNGTLTKLVNFTGTNGIWPRAALTLGRDGNFYGTTGYGGTSGDGTVFKVNTDGTLTTLYSFTGGTNGALPSAKLTLDDDGSFYGTTQYGGTSSDGTAFNVTTNGTLTTLCSFTGGANGVSPSELTLGNDGNFYGTTVNGGNGDYGMVFKVTTNGALTTLYLFTGGTNGADPLAGLTLGDDGSFYGTTYNGGSSDCGTVFKVTTNGTLTTICSFTGGTNGADPSSALTLGNDGSFYGTTPNGGRSGHGTVFNVTTNGALTTLHSFTGGTNGSSPYAALTLGSDGSFYGTTYTGGSNDAGTVFCLLLPVITVQPQSQTNGVGATVIFTVSAISLNPVGYQWQRNGTNLVDVGNISGARSNMLTITGISNSDAASYAVVVNYANNNVTSSNAVLTVSDLPVVATQPQSQIVLVGSNVTFSAAAYGAPPLVFQWLFKGVAFGSPVGGTNFSSCTLTNVGTNQSGNYSVQVVNGYGSVTSSIAALTVVAFPPTISTQPVNRTNKAGTTATFSVVASSVGPLSYQWQKNGTNLVNGGTISGVTNSTLTVPEFNEDALRASLDLYLQTVSHIAVILAAYNPVLLVGLPLLQKFEDNPPLSGFFEECQAETLWRLIPAHYHTSLRQIVETDEEVLSIIKWMNDLPDKF